MEFRSHRRYYPENVVIYVERYNKDKGEIVFDFFESNDHALFISQLNLNKSQYSSSMVLLKNYWLRRLQEGTYYSISSKTIRSWLEDDEVSIESDIDSFLIGYEINLGDAVRPREEIFNFSISLNFESKFYFGYRLPNYPKREIPIPRVDGEAKVIVRNVGQGNWNEIIVDNNYVVVFDVGGSFTYTKSEIRTLIETRKKEYEINNPLLTISHWDFDHYHSLLGLEDEELANFSSIVCRDSMPNLTTRILGQRLRKVLGNDRIYGIPAERKTHRRGLPRLIKINSNTDQLVLYNAQEHKDRNKSGIALTLKRANSSVLFSGDLHYDQLNNDILPDINYAHKHYLIVPHHGGKAGCFNYLPNKKVKCADAIISVGKNSYRHPLRDNVQNLKKMFNVKSTRKENTDILIKLD